MIRLPPLLNRIRPLLAGSEAYLVGGAVRDALLGRPIHDLDFVLAGDAIRLARSVADRLRLPFYVLDAERGMGRIIATENGERTTVDFARFRGPDLLADLMARDFTINALALPATASDEAALIDPLGGCADLAARRLRATSDRALRDDPVRVIRAVRLAAQLGLAIEPHTWSLLQAEAARVGQPAAERSRDELAHILAGPGPAAALRRLDDLGALAILIPEIEALKGVTQSPPHWRDVWDHTLDVVTRLEAVLAALGLQPAISGQQEGPIRWPEVGPDLRSALDRYRPYLAEHLAVRLSDERPRRGLLVLAALLHDVGKPGTRSVDQDGRIHFYNHEQVGARLAELRLRALRFSADETAWVTRIIAGHMRPGHLAESSVPLSRRAIYRYYRVLGEAGPDVGLLALADHLATWGTQLQAERWARRLEIVATLMEHYFRRYTQTIAPPPLLTGDDLINELELKPGPAIGQILEAIREAQAAGEVRSRAEALALARSIQPSAFK